MRFSEAITKTTEYTLSGFNVSVVAINLGESAFLRVEFYGLVGENEVVKAVKDVALVGDDYAKWGSDDDYITQYIVDNLDKIL